MPKLSSFQSLLEQLYEHQLSMPMEGQVDDTPLALSDIKHPAINPDGSLDWSKFTDDTAEKAKVRIAWNKKFSAAEDYQGQSVYRMNHGLTHAIRTMGYVEPVVNYLKHWGNDSLKAFANRIDDNELQKLMLVAAFISIARDSEIDFGTQPGPHHAYRQKAVACFKQYYDAREALPEDIKSLFDLFENPEELAQYIEALTVLGDDRNESDIHVILNMCHKLDLYRCRERRTANTSVDKYIREHSKGNYGEGISNLTAWAMACIQATGNEVKAKGLDYDLDQYLPCNTSPEHAIQALGALPQPSFTDTHPDEENPLAAPFFFKSIRADAGDYWEKYIEWVTPSPLNCTPHEALRKGSKGTFSAKMKRTADGELEWRVIERAQDKPMYTPEEKKGFAKHSSLSYAEPLHAYEPPVFGLNRDRADLLVGIRLEAKDVLINRIMQYDGGTVGRPFEFHYQKEAEDFLAAKLKSGTYCQSLAQLVHNNKTGKHNEILGRVKKISAIAVFSDNLESRVLAQLRAKQYQLRLNEQQRELGLPVEPTAVMPIVFYLPKDTKNYKRNHTEYDAKAQAEDLNAAETHPDCKVYLEKIAALNKDFASASPASPFKTKYEIQTIHQLAASGELKALEAFLAQNPTTINTQDLRGMTAAHYAALNNRQAILACLSEHNADLSLPNKQDERPCINQNQYKYYFTDNHLINAAIFKKIASQPISDGQLTAVSFQTIDHLNQLLPLLTAQEIQKTPSLEDDLKRIIQSPWDFNQVVWHLLDDESRIVVCDLLTAHLPSIMTSADDFRILSYFKPEQRTAIYQSLKDNLPSITTPHDLSALLKHLTPEQCTEVCDSLKTQIPNIIKSPNDFAEVLHRLTPEQRTAVYHSLKNDLPSITNSYGLNTLLKCLTPEQCTEVCDSLKAKIPDIVKSAFDFNSVCSNLGPEQRTAVYHSLQAHLPSIIKSGEDFDRLMYPLSSEQRDALYLSLEKKLPSIIKSAYDIHYALKHLNPAQYERFFHALKMHFSEIFDDPYQLNSVFENLSPAEFTARYEALKSHLPNIITSADYLGEFMERLDIPQRTPIYHLLKANLPGFIHSASDFCHVLRQLTPEQRTEVYETYPDDLTRLITSPNTFYSVLVYLSPEQCKAVCSALTNKLPQFIKSIRDLQSAIVFLDSTQRATVFLAILQTYKLSWFSQQQDQHRLHQLIDRTDLNPVFKQSLTKFLETEQSTAIEGIGADALSPKHIIQFIFPNQSNDNSQGFFKPPNNLKLQLQLLKTLESRTSQEEVRESLYQFLAQLPPGEDAVEVGSRTLTFIHAVETNRPSAAPKLSPSC